ncbi:MAG: tetratricopeptide repeat protein [Candidatus Omnitrophica bacterium]|nr:tetratricopeptide repeat protein [Candidatus Omnitrophota bacterium]
MDKNVFFKNIFPLLISLILAVTFFVSYNQYLLDRSLANLKVSLRTLEKTKDIKEVQKLKDILDDTFLMEITKKDLDLSALVKIELSSQTIEKVFKDDQLKDVSYFLGDVVRKKEQNRNPLFVAFDSFIANMFPQKRGADVAAVSRQIEQLNSQLSLYSGEALQAKYMEIARLYIRIKDFENARQFLEKASSIVPESEGAFKAKLYLAFLYKFEKNYAKTIELLKQIKDKLPPELSAFSSYQEGDCLYRMGKVDEAVQVFRGTFEKNPTLETSQFSQFRAGYINLYDKKNEEEAYGDFMKLESLKVDTKGHAYLMQGGKKIYEGSLEPLNLVSYNKLSAHINETLIPTVAKKYRNSGFKLLGQGYQLLRKDLRDNATITFREALNQFSTALKFYAQDAFSYSGRALAFYFLENKEEALKEARKANAMGPNSPVILANLAFVYFGIGMVDEAIDEYRKALTLAPNSAFLYYNLGTIYILKGDVGSATAHLESAIKLNPQFAYPYNNRGYLLWSKGAFKEAKVNFERAVSLNPEYTDAYYNLGILFFTLEDYEKAREEFMLAAKLVPHYKQLDQYLSQISEKLKEEININRALENITN